MCPASSTAPELASTIRPHASDLQADASGPSVPFFATYHVPESQSDAAAEAIRQAGIMMEGVQAVHESSQAAYDASAALRANVQVNQLPTEFVLLGYVIRMFSFAQYFIVLHFEIVHPLGAAEWNPNQWGHA